MEKIMSNLQEDSSMVLGYLGNAKKLAMGVETVKHRSHQERFKMIADDVQIAIDCMESIADYCIKCGVGIYQLREKLKMCEDCKNEP